MTSRRMVPGPIASTDALLRAYRENGGTIGGMPGSLTRAVTADGRWFLDGEGYINGSDEAWTIEATGGVRYRLTFFDASKAPSWELAAESSAGRSVARTARAGSRLRTLAIGVAVVAAVIGVAFAMRKAGS